MMIYERERYGEKIEGERSAKALVAYASFRNNRPPLWGPYRLR